MNAAKAIVAVLLFCFVHANACAQTASLATPPSPSVKTSGTTTNVAAPDCGREIRSTYLLGPDDQIEISGPELTEFAGKPGRIDSEGNIQAPLAGRVHVAGLTAQQAEEALDKALNPYIRDPQVVVNVSEIHSQPVSVLGAVNTPGVHQVQGHKTLLEMLSQAGGVRQDAGYSVRITRQLEWGCIPLPGAKLDPTGKFSVAEVSLMKIMEAKDPAENIQIFPHDVITVPKAEMIYVIGDVHRSGGFVLGEHQSMSVLEALSLAEGLERGSNEKHARILRLNRDADQREELPVNIKELFSGKKKDVSLQAEDILFVPGSTGKKAALRALDAAIQAGTGVAVWRVP